MRLFKLNIIKKWFYLFLLLLMLTMFFLPYSKEYTTVIPGANGFLGMVRTVAHIKFYNSRTTAEVLERIYTEDYDYAVRYVKFQNLRIMSLSFYCSAIALALAFTILAFIKKRYLPAAIPTALSMVALGFSFGSWRPFLSYPFTVFFALLIAECCYYLVKLFIFLIPYIRKGLSHLSNQINSYQAKHPTKAERIAELEKQIAEIKDNHSSNT